MQADTLDDGTQVHRLVAGMKSDGMPLPEGAVLEAVRNPAWDGAGSAHDWRAHVPTSLRAIWETLPMTTRLCVFETAELIARTERQGAAMVTGPADQDTG